MASNTCKRVVLKLTGEIFLDTKTKNVTPTLIHHIAAQIKQLQSTHQFSIVIGGGNFFRGTQHGPQLGITPSVGHHVGMLATMMNGLIVKDLFEQQGITTTVFSALTCPQIGDGISPQSIADALQKNHTVIFVGGTGNPFFTTDTNAVLRALELGAQEVWKATDIDGVYTADPDKDPHATRLSYISYDQALEQRLAIMDATAFTLARHHKQTIRVFNIFEPDALIHAAQDNNFGSTIN